MPDRDRQMSIFSFQKQATLLEQAKVSRDNSEGGSTPKQTKSKEDQSEFTTVMKTIDEEKKVSFQNYKISVIEENLVPDDDLLPDIKEVKSQ